MNIHEKHHAIYNLREWAEDNPRVLRFDRGGLCGQLVGKVRFDDLVTTELLVKLFESWTHFSGSLVYPVPSSLDDPCMDPRDVFHNTLNMWEGKYGEARKALCLYLADRLEGMV
jgi:hypothetical protein